jgi:hypothetical protein
MTRTLSAENLKQSSRDFPVAAISPIELFVMFVGPEVWSARIADIAARSAVSNRLGGVIRQTHALELALERMRSRAAGGASVASGTPSVAEQKLHEILVEAVSTIERLNPAGAERLRERLRAGLSGDGTLVESFHLFRTAALHQARGFSLSYTGLEQGTPYDFVLSRDGVEMECVCETISAEAGRDVHRRAWAQFCDRIEGQMKPWLGTRPGRYLLKMTLARGLRNGRTELIDSLQARVLAMLEGGARLDQDETAVLRVEPLTMSASSPTVDSLMTRLRRDFGPEAHLSVSASADGVWAMAARAGRRNEVAAVIRAHLDRLAPGRVSGERPALLSLFVEDLDRAEWRGLRDSLELEGAARHFMTCGGAAAVVAVTCYSRMEMFGLTGPDAVAEGELRFRNPAHPAAKNAALAPAILSSL